MKKFTFTFLVIILLTSVGSAQSIGVFGGLTNSAFEDNPIFDADIETSNGFEVGAVFLIDALPILEAGVEYSTSVSPFEIKSEYSGSEFTQKNSQSMFGAFVKFNFSVPAVTPYLRAGAGYYSGSSETNLTPQALKDAAGLDADYKSTLGFNVGAGIDTFIGLNAEFIYHIVSKELDVEDAASLGANYWGLRIGYYFSLL